MDFLTLAAVAAALAVFMLFLYAMTVIAKRQGATTLFWTFCVLTVLSWIFIMASFFFP
jgi:hypothetical protein